jgi:hypothetical protein
MAIISCTITFLLIIYFSFHFELQHFMLGCLYKKYPSWTREYIFTFTFKYSYMGIHKDSNRNRCTQRKHYLHWVPIASEELIQASSFRCTLSLLSVRSSQATQCRHPIQSGPWSLRQQLFIRLPLAACINTLLREDCLVFTAMHFHVPISQLYICCIRHRNWSPFPFYPSLIFVVVVYACVCLCLLCFLFIKCIY